MVAVTKGFMNTGYSDKHESELNWWHTTCIKVQWEGKGQAGNGVTKQNDNWLLQVYEW